MVEVDTSSELLAMPMGTSAGKEDKGGSHQSSKAQGPGGWAHMGSVLHPPSHYPLHPIWDLKFYRSLNLTRSIDLAR